MYTKTIALTGAFAVLASAVPMAAKRDVVWVTKVEEDVVTVPVTTTVWVDPTGAPSHFGHNNHGGHKKQSTVQTTVNVYASAPPAPSAPAASVPVAPASAPSPSSYFAPSAAPAPSSSEAAPVAESPASSAAPSSSSIYVAPTTSTSVYVAPTSPSAYVAPTTSSSVYVAPTTSSVYVAPTSSSAAPSSYSSSSGSSGSSPYHPAAADSPETATPLTSGDGASGKSYTGDFTYYGVGLGACGITNFDDQAVVAVSHTLFDSYPGGNDSPICGQMLNIQAADGSTIQAKVVDRCVGCAEEDLDMSETLFNAATYSTANTWCGASACVGNGRVHNMKWSFA